MSDPADKPEAPPEYIDLLESVHDFGHLVVALSEHHAVILLRKTLAEPDSASRTDLLERLREIVQPDEYAAVTARHGRP